MKILVLGAGGREHAFVSALRRSPQQPEVFASPGNAGIGEEATLFPSNPTTPEGIDALIAEVQSRGIDLTLVGPEAPLVAGVVDRFRNAGLRIFGPTAQAAQLEGSKCFSKEFLARHNIPTARFEIFDNPTSAYAYLETHPLPIVVKADGLAAGKGVIVAQTREEACQAIDAMLVEGRFGEAGKRVVIEECLRGSEISLFVIAGDDNYVLLETAQDYTPIHDGDRGPNTGGRGPYSPYYETRDPVIEKAKESILEPTLRGMRADGMPYQGILYAGLMLTDDGPQVIEYNVRFGDPEAQTVLTRLRSDLVDCSERAIDGTLTGFTPKWDERHAVCVVAASAGYPGSYPKGHIIEGLDEATSPHVKVYHAGTARDAAGNIVTSGGRVLGVTALGKTRDATRDEAYAALNAIHFDGIQYRSDIAAGSR